MPLATQVLSGADFGTAHAVALQRRPEGVISAAVEAVRSILGPDLAYAAMPGSGDMGLVHASEARDPRFRQMRVRRGRGLGGQVLTQLVPMAVSDYAADPRITDDFVDIVSNGEGIHSVVCVPVQDVAGEVCALLYAAQRSVGALNDRAVDMLAQLAVYAGIGIQNAEDRAQEAQLQRLRDRQRLAGLLHDTVAQELFSVGVTARHSLQSTDVQTLLDAMREIDDTARDARGGLRNALKDIGECEIGVAFEARLRAELALFERRSGCMVRILRTGARRTLPDLVQDLVLETALEGLRNAVKHADAAFAVVYLDYRADELSLTVLGRIDRATPRSCTESTASTGVGLAMLTQQAGRLRARLEMAESVEGKGLRLRVPCLQPPLNSASGRGVQ